MADEEIGYRVGGFTIDAERNPPPKTRGLCSSRARHQGPPPSFTEEPMMFLSQPNSTDAVARMYESNQAAQGFVMNLASAWAWRPDVFESFAALRSQLSSSSSLSRRDQAVIVCATASQLRDSYCSLAWGKTLAAEAGAATAAAVLADREDAALTARDGMLAAWARKLVADPNSTTPSDIDALRSVGLDDRAIFEATAFAAFRLAFSTVNDALGANPDWQLADTAPAEVRAAVTYGRPPQAAPGDGAPR